MTTNLQLDSMHLQLNIMQELSRLAAKHGIIAETTFDHHNIDITQFGSTTKQYVPLATELTLTLRGELGVMGQLLMVMLQVLEEDTL